MGIKGDKLTQDSIIVAELIMERLASIGNISIKKMFGGHGIFCEGNMFGIVNSKGEAYLKADETNKPDYDENGSHQHGKMPYFSIPDEVMNDPDQLVEWSKKSIVIAKKK